MPLIFGAFDLPEGRKPPEPIKPEEPPPPEPPEPIDPDILYQIDWGDIDGTDVLAEHQKLQDEYAQRCETHEQEMERYVLECEEYQQDHEEWKDLCCGLIEEWTQNVGVIWEHLNVAGPIAVNGHPTFFSFHIMHKEDWERAFKAIKREEKRRKSIEI
jgi:hypothetical protein